MDRNKHAKPTGKAQTVALRKESVDRNLDTVQVIIVVVQSLSARRAWIEIHFMARIGTLRSSRSPQGERG